MSKKEKTKSNTTTTGTTTATPVVPGYAAGPVTDYFGQVGGLIGDTSTATPDPLENQAYSAAGGLLTDDLAHTDLTPYTDPYEEDVVQRSLGDINRFREGAISGNQAAATQAHAYGGSRHGIADSETNRNFIDQAGLLSSSLRSAGFDRARQAAQFDITNRRGNIGLLSDLGARRRMTPIDRLRSLQGLLGIDLSSLLGRDVNQTGTQATTGSSSSTDWGQILGSILQAGAYVAGSDRRLKTDIEPVGEREGVPWYRFRYLWDEPGVRRVGVMAQDLIRLGRSDAVSTDDDGYYMVNYGLL